MIIHIIRTPVGKWTCCEECFDRQMKGAGDNTTYIDSFEGNFCPNCGKKEEE